MNKPKARSLSELYEEISSSSNGSNHSSIKDNSLSRTGGRRDRMMKDIDTVLYERHKKIGSLFLRDNQDSEDKRLTEGNNVLSWDCGITNLCYCLLELVKDDDGDLDFRIIMWENFSLNSQTLMQATSALVKELDNRPWMMDVDSVCIENQVLKNVQMKVMSHAIQCYFVTRGAARARDNSTFSQLPNGIKITRKGLGGPNVHFIKADSKFKAVNHIVIPDRIEKLSRRIRNKRAAIYTSTELLREKGYTTALNFLQSFEKQDDLSDSFLQGLYFLRQQQKSENNKKKLKRLMGMNEISIEKDKVKKTKKNKKTNNRLRIDRNTGTQKEEYDTTLDGMNEGCEYDKEVPLPQMYRNRNFVVPRYDTSKADISRITRYMRSNLLTEKEEDEDQQQEEEEEESTSDIELFSLNLKKNSNKKKCMLSKEEEEQEQEQEQKEKTKECNLLKN